MSLAHGSSIVTNGLILYYDMYNTKKSFKGPPITNYIPNPYASWNGSSFVLGYNYANLGATYTYVTGVENPINSPGVLQYYTGTSGYKYFSIDSSSLPATGTYTFSYYARLVNGTASGAPIDSQLWRANGSDRSVTGDWNPTFTASWRRYATTGPAEASTVLQYFPVHSGNIIGGYTIQYCGFQLELNSYATTFVSGTRSTTQAIVDLTGKNTLTTNSLTYNSDGTFSFNGSNSVISAPNNTIFDTQTPSVEVWIKTNALSQNGFFFEKGTVNTEYSLFQEGANIVWRQGSNSLYATTASYISTSQWAHIVGTYTSGSRNLYINGVLVASDSLSATVGTNSGGITIGSYNSGGYFYNGSIGTVKVYNRALSAAEILQNFNANRSRFGI